VCHSNGGKASRGEPLGMGYARRQAVVQRHATLRAYIIHGPGADSVLAMASAQWLAGHSSYYAWHGGSVRISAGCTRIKSWAMAGCIWTAAEPYTGSGRLHTDNSPGSGGVL
jgi:hypothetical protein